MRIYEERRSREMWVEKDWVVLKKHRRCDMFGRENLTSFCGALKVRNINSRVRSARKNRRNYWGSAEGAKLLLMERLLRPSQWQTTRLYSPDCSGILLRNEVQQKIQRKAGRDLNKSKNFLAPAKPSLWDSFALLAMTENNYIFEEIDTSDFKKIPLWKKIQIFGG